ncbi:MAG: penicillin acylase family protein [Deltaproteobacteria bacterium]|nr:penicillin acylase family protein [Deltaproteobacteria bacterium]
MFKAFGARLRPLFSVIAASVFVFAFVTGCDEGEDDEDEGVLPVAQEVPVEGLQEPVEVYLDAYGVPHIYAMNDHDALFSQGYLAARDRFFEMDMARRLGSGRLGELLGQVPALGTVVAELIAWEVDLYFRSLLIGLDGRPVADSIYDQIKDDDWVMGLLNSYCDGVNAYLADLIARRNGVTEPPVYNGIVDVRPEHLEPWTPRDIISILMVNSWSASNSVSAELSLAEALEALGPEKFLDFYRAQPVTNVTALGAGGEKKAAAVDKEAQLAALKKTAERLAPAMDAIRAAREATDAARTTLASQGFHSNNWAVDAAHSATGNALIANDPHLSMLNPPFFWLSHVDSVTLGSGSLSFAGLSVPGAPGAHLGGHNGRVAWGETNAYYDVYDAYIETYRNGAVEFEGDEVPVYHAQQEFNLDLDGRAGSVKYPVQIVPHHGAIVPGSCKKGHCVSLRWTGSEPGRELYAFMDLLYVENVGEALDALEQYRRGAYNWALADTSGNIGYIAGCEVPIRENWQTQPPYLPLPGTGGAEWIGSVPDEAIACQMNPARGYVATANNDIYGTLLDNDVTNDEYYFYFNTDLGLRAGRIDEMLSGTDLHFDANALTLDDMKRMQTDTTSDAARRLVPFLQAAAENLPKRVDADMRDALDLFESWNFTTPSGTPDFWRPEVPPRDVQSASAATLVFHTWWAELIRATFGDEFKKAKWKLPSESAPPQYETKALLTLLENPEEMILGEAWWDDVGTPFRVETRDETLLNALHAALARLEEDMGPDWDDWRWGEAHTAEYGVSFEGITVPSFISPVLGPGAADGGNFTVNVANWTDADDFRDSHSPAARFVAEAQDDGFMAYAILPGGQSERYDSPHYDDQFPLYLSGEYIPIPFHYDDVLAVADDHLRLVPLEE